jgi:hypothetical protein
LAAAVKMGKIEGGGRLVGRWALAAAAKTGKTEGASWYMMMTERTSVGAAAGRREGGGSTCLQDGRREVEMVKKLLNGVGMQS